MNAFRSAGDCRGQLQRAGREWSLCGRGIKPQDIHWLCAVLQNRNECEKLKDLDLRSNEIDHKAIAPMFKFILKVVYNAYVCMRALLCVCVCICVCSFLCACVCVFV